MITEFTQSSYRLINRVLPVTVAPLDDARLGDLAKSLGLKLDFVALADADPAEIRERQNMIKWLLQNQSIMARPFFSEGGRASYNDTLPDQSYPFMEYQELLRQQQTHFWKRVALFRQAAEALYQLPPRIANLLNVLGREGQVRHLEELGVVDEILADLRGVASFRGILRFKINSRYGSEAERKKSGEETGMAFPSASKLSYRGMWRIPGVRSLAFYGTWVYHKALDRPIEKFPKPLVERAAAKLRLKPLAKLLGYLRWRKLVAPAQIGKIPREVACDVATYLNSLFSSKNGFYNKQPFIVKVGYTYDESGLKACLLDWKLKGPTQLEQGLSSRDFGYGERTGLAGRVERKQARIARSREGKKNNADMNQWFLEHAGYQEADAPSTYREFCCHRFGTVYAKFRERIEAIQRWQGQVEQAMDDLCTLREIAKGFEDSELAYFYPEIVTAETILEITRCYPIRLRAQEDKQLVPFQALSVDGQIVNLTGRNGSGKSTAMLSALDVQLMAQCGLPVFAQSAKISPRRHILLSFLDRSSTESTYRAKLIKDMAIVRAIKALEPEERKSVLVIIDELGSATDQIDVMRVVKPLIAWLAKQGVSVIMSTQIPELSEFIGASCNGANFLIQPDYDIAAGIGKGEPFEVATEMGLFELLTWEF